MWCSRYGGFCFVVLVAIRCWLQSLRQIHLELRGQCNRFITATRYQVKSCPVHRNHLSRNSTEDIHFYISPTLLPHAHPRPERLHLCQSTPTRHAIHNAAPIKCPNNPLTIRYPTTAEMLRKPTPRTNVCKFRRSMPEILMPDFSASSICVVLCRSGMYLKSKVVSSRNPFLPSTMTFQKTLRRA